MARPKKTTEETAVLSIRFPLLLIGKIDRYVKRFKKANPGLSFGRADAIRLLLTKAVSAKSDIETDADLLVSSTATE